MIEKTVGLAGGVLLTKRAGGEVWSYPNIHGDITTTRTATGAAVASGKLNDPFGNPTNGYLDNSAGNSTTGGSGNINALRTPNGIRNVIEMGAASTTPPSAASSKPTPSKAAPATTTPTSTTP